MKFTKLFLFTFVSMMWSMNADAFVYEGINYDFVSEAERTVVVVKQLDPDLLVGDVKIPSKVIIDGKEYTVTIISGAAFTFCNKMTSIAIPPTVQYIEYGAFEGLDGLEAVYLEDIAAWCSVNLVATNSNPISLAHHLFVNGEEVKELVIPDGVTSIGNFAFQGASAIISVVIPSSVEAIGIYTFADCTALKDVYCYAETVPNIQSRSFIGTDLSNVTLHVPATSVDQYKATWTEFKDVVPIADVTGVERLRTEEQNGEWYQLNGQRATSPKHGLNIIRMKDGTSKKVVYRE